MSKVIVITGAGAGLGKNLAQRFAAEGERVVLLGRTLAKLEAVAAPLGERAVAVACDVGSPESVRSAFAQIAQRFAQIDVLINNAAVFEPARVAQASDLHIVNTINTNLTGAVLCARAAIPMMNRGGHIINVSSEAVEVPFLHLTLYQTSKAGLERFSLCLRRELEADGIRVSIVRAGKMFEAGKTWDVDPQALQSFAQANLEAGIDITRQPISAFKSVTGMFRALIDLPPDLDVAQVQLLARAPGP